MEGHQGANTEWDTAAGNDAGAGAVGSDYAEVRRVLERAVAEGDVPGILAEISDGGETWFGAAGVAEVETGRAFLPQDRFRIGSTTKTFTATVVLQLAAERRLSLDDTVEKWLPGVVYGNGHDGGKITIRHLLRQTSGVFNYLLDLEKLFRRDRWRPDQLVEIAMTYPPDFEPGTDWRYSNTNFILAGMIIERATGGAFADAVSRRIAQPLGLTGTYMPDDPAVRGTHGRFYSKLYSTDPDAAIHDATEIDPSPFWAAGGMISTVGDLNRFFAALLGGRLLPPAQQGEMFTTVPTKDWIPDTMYGLGISSVKLSCGVTVWGHGGSILGSWSYTYGTRDGVRVVAQHMNGDWSDQIGISTDVLRAVFCPNSSGIPPS